MKKKLVVFSILICVILALRFSPLANYVTLAQLQKNKEWLLAVVTNNYFLSAIIYTLFYLLTVAFSFPGAAILTMAGGMLFGVLHGCILVNVGATLGAAGAFMVVRYFLYDEVQKRYGARLAEFNENIRRHGAYYLLAVRLVPIFPFFLINIVAALTPIRLITFLWTTSVGIIPGSLVYLYAGTQLRSVRTPHELLSPGMLLAFFLLALLAMIPVVARLLWGRR